VSRDQSFKCHLLFLWSGSSENSQRKVLTDFFNNFNLAIHFRGEAHSFVCFAGMVEENGAEKCSEKAQRMTCLGITGGMRSTPTYALEVVSLTFVHRQAANRLLGNGCSYVPNFAHSEVLIKMTEEMPLLMAPKDKFVTFYIFGRKFSVDFPTREDWSAECVDLVAPDGVVFFTGGSGQSWCRRIL
jgi:hypothetical protein